MDIKVWLMKFKVESSGGCRFNPNNSKNNKEYLLLLDTCTYLCLTELEQFVSMD